MTTAKDTVNRLFDAWNHKDIDGIAALINDDVILDGPLEKFQGKALYLEGAQKVFGNFREFRVLDQFSNDSTVISVIDIVMNVPGGEFIQNCVEYSKVSGGKLDSTVAYYDATELKRHYRMDEQGIPLRRSNDSNS